MALALGSEYCGMKITKLPKKSIHAVDNKRIFNAIQYNTREKRNSVHTVSWCTKYNYTFVCRFSVSVLFLIGLSLFILAHMINKSHESFKIKSFNNLLRKRL